MTTLWQSYGTISRQKLNFHSKMGIFVLNTVHYTLNLSQIFVSRNNIVQGCKNTFLLIKQWFGSVLRKIAFWIPVFLGCSPHKYTYTYVSTCFFFGTRRYQFFKIFYIQQKIAVKWPIISLNKFFLLQIEFQPNHFYWYLKSTVHYLWVHAWSIS